MSNKQNEDKQTSGITALPTDLIRDVMQLINSQGRITTVIVVDDIHKVLGTVTDGDIRRGLLGNITMNDEISKVMNNSPIMVPSSMPKENMLELMKVNDIFHLPVVDIGGKLVGVQERINDEALANGKMVAVIMAGGEGLRLRPLTENVPKPMLKVSNKPILEILIECLARCEFKKFIINLGYLGEVIEDYFKDGSHLGIDISYVREPKRLGTAGALGLLPKDQRPKDSFLVINGDLLTNLNFKMFREFHINGDYSFTLCGRPHKVQIPFGYPVVNGDLVTDMREKPEFTYLVNSGIYCLSPDLIDYVPKNEFFNMTDVIDCCMKDNRRVGMFPLGEKFHEIGRHESYDQAHTFYQEVFGNS